MFSSNSQQGSNFQIFPQMSNYSFQSCLPHSVSTTQYIWFGVIQKLQNKYLIWFNWEHTSPPCLGGATEAR